MPLLTDPDALNAPINVQTPGCADNCCRLNRISASLAETPGKHRPRSGQVDAEIFDSMDRRRIADGYSTDFAEKQWRPVVRVMPFRCISSPRFVSSATPPEPATIAVRRSRSRRKDPRLLNGKTHKADILNDRPKSPTVNIWDRVPCVVLIVDRLVTESCAPRSVRCHSSRLCGSVFLLQPPCTVWRIATATSRLSATPTRQRLREIGVKPNDFVATRRGRLLPARLHGSLQGNEQQYGSSDAWWCKR